MGADDFMVLSSGEDADEAFKKAVEEAQYDWGHSGYTGTIAEKDDFIIVSLPEDRFEGETNEDMAYRVANELMENDDYRVKDKWGPAGCIDIGNGTFLFFGWASS